MLDGAPYSVSGITSQFSCRKTPKFIANKSSELTCRNYSKNERECETQVRQSGCLHGVHQSSAICCLGTSGLQRFQHCS